ncbi:hypothetical protein [Nannocystis sp. SCPEA4]|uniref:leucine-rich repeat domain-containing protein n=1 Tax=Nannocystis sp. SCPEA4 TaxID=2996787 RepID=UPI00227057B0|nr:hypothetical protein [Nannocystis sp. SCPEA4]MCY1056521.1 hypothetical protein [Nannocystis sp. SCPEA4]
MRWNYVVALLVACTPPPLEGDAGTTTGTGTTTTTGATTEGAPTTTDGEATLTSETGDTTSSPPMVGCPEGDVVLKTQDDVVAVAGCVEFPGDVTVQRDVVDLAPLTGVRRIAGTLTVGGYTHALESMVTSLDAFAELEHVGGLELTNVDVAHLLMFSGLTEVPGSVSIVGFDRVDTLEGLHNITQIGGRLRVSGLDGLSDLTGLRGLERVGAGLQLDNLYITDLHGLESLTTIGEPGGEPALVWFAYLQNLNSLDALMVDWHDAIDVALTNTSVSDLGVFSGVSELHGITLESCPLTSLAGLESLVHVRGWFRFVGNANLVDIGALANLETLGGLDISSAPFDDLSPLVSLTHLGSLTVSHSKFTDLAPLPALQQLDHVDLFLNSEMVDLTLLAGVTSLESLRLYRNAALVDMPELSGLAEVKGDVYIGDNASLPGLGDLAALKTIGGRLAVVVNPALPQADAIAWADAITVAGDRKIAGNKDSGPPLDPCPWNGDGECDQPYVCADDTDDDCCQGACE